MSNFGLKGVFLRNARFVKHRATQKYDMALSMDDKGSDELEAPFLKSFPINVKTILLSHFPFRSLWSKKQLIYLKLSKRLLVTKETG